MRANKSVVRVANFFLLIITVTGGRVVAQPAIPGPGAYGFQVVDLGDVGIGHSVLSPAVAVTPGELLYFRLRLTTAISPLTNWLDLDTSGSSISNTEMAVYDEWANKKEDNDDSGVGDKAAMSFGGGSAEKLSGTGGRISDGREGSLNAGVYYVAVLGANANFSVDPNTDWDVQTTSAVSGNLRLRVSTGQVPTTYWNERHHGDAGDTLGNAQIVHGYGPLTNIVTSFAADDRDMFKIRICDPASFQATATLTSTSRNGSGVSYRASLFIFDSTGRGVTAINNKIAGTVTTLGLPTNSPVGEYYLAISDYCPQATGEIEPNPYDSQGQLIWAFGNSSQPLPPNGPGQDNPLESWGRLASSCEVSSYHARISLTGACLVPVEMACPIDLNGDEMQDLLDYAKFQNCFETR